jgi:hypothetical protein
MQMTDQYLRDTASCVGTTLPVFQRKLLILFSR